LFELNFVKNKRKKKRRKLEKETHFIMKIVSL